MAINIEPNKFYRTRDGRKARIYATDGGDKESVHGAIYQGAGWWLAHWTASGSYYRDGQLAPSDLIAEWVDLPVVDWDVMPAWANFVAMDEDKSWYWFDLEPEPRSAEWKPRTYGVGTYGRIPPTHAPTFTGRWTTSLVSRP